MSPARIAELLQPFLGSEGLRPNTAELISSISTYIDILLRWNARINLTAIRTPEEIVTRHFGESLFAARHLFGGRAALQGRVTSIENSGVSANDQRLTTNDGVTLADVGSGAGFPGIPIKLWAPQISLTLIESNHKKAAFLREIARAITLTDINIQAVRAESLAGQTFNVVTLRAVERFAKTLPAAAALLAPQGRLALLIGASQSPQATKTLPSLTWSNPIPIPLSTTRTLLIGQNTPE